MDLERRLHRLEIKNRLLYALLALMAAYISIGYVNAAADTKNIIVDSITTRSFSLIDSNGHKKVTIGTGNAGTLAAFYSDLGKQTLSFGVLPTGQPSICLADAKTCRIVVGEVFRGQNREMNIELHDENGHTIWIPQTENFLTMEEMGSK